MLLIVGLGNPGAKHARQRHNIGFMAVDAIHRRHGFGPWRKRFQAEVAEGVLAGEKCLLVKPQTYMNRSGQAVGEAAGFFKLSPTDILVIHDEVDLPPGKIRMKTGGGGAGHNGLKSIGSAIGSEFRRLRIGVGRPSAKEGVPNYVLHDFAKADAVWLSPLLDAIADHAPLLAEGKDSTFANRLHESAAPQSDAGGKQPPALETTTKATTSSKDVPPPDDSPGQRDGPLARGLKRLFGYSSN
jgi:peptidyl-tRNA hydrolase, PTH1 family